MKRMLEEEMVRIAKQENLDYNDPCLQDELMATAVYNLQPPRSLQELLKTDLKDEILAIILESSSRMNWRRDSLKQFFKEKKIKASWTMAELKSLADVGETQLRFQDLLLPEMKLNMIGEEVFSIECKDKEKLYIWIRENGIAVSKYGWESYGPERKSCGTWDILFRKN